MARLGYFTPDQWADIYHSAFNFQVFFGPAIALVVREGLQKKEKNVEFFTSRYFTPPPCQDVENLFFFLLTIFLDVLAHFKHIRGKKYFSP